METPKKEREQTTVSCDMKISELARKLSGYVSQLRGQPKVNNTIPCMRILCGDIYMLVDEIVAVLDKEAKREVD